MDDKVAMWVFNNDACFGIFTYHCPNCGAVRRNRVFPSGRCAFENFCSNCGLRMRGFKTDRGIYDLNGIQIGEVKNGKTD